MHTRTVAFSILMLVTVSRATNAQEIIVKKKPGEGQWTISYSRKYSPTNFELHTGCKTLAVAKKEAQKLIAWSNSMDPRSTYRLSVIEIEGEDARTPKPEGPRFSSWADSDSYALNSLRNDTRDTLKSFVQEDAENAFKKRRRELEDVFNRAKELKLYMVRNVGDLSKEKINEVNAAISRYNSRADAYSSQQPGGDYFAALPRMSPVTPELSQQADEWRKAKREQFALEDEKGRLDVDQERLSAERKRLLEENRELKAKENEFTQKKHSQANRKALLKVSGKFQKPGIYLASEFSCSHQERK